ncbi:MAG: OsmC family protein [Candidatus Eisenbacteria bacterium]|nr:OsmC family protein [Candidatus Eisenbacteria bacterium]
MSNTAHLELKSIEQGLRMEVVAGSGTAMTLDSGEGMIAPTPVEALLAALGGCLGMDVISLLRKKRQRVTAYSVDLEGERRTEHPRSFTKIEVVHRLTGHDLSAAAIEDSIRLSETHYCTVYHSLDPKIGITSRYEIIAA